MMTTLDFHRILFQVACTLNSNQPHERRVLLASNQVANALSMLEQPQYAAAGEAALMDEALAEFRRQPVVYLTAAEMDAIEAERPGEDFSLRPFEW